MFTRSSKTDMKKPETALVPRRETNGAPSIISANVHVSGDIDSPGEVQLDGEVNGNIRCSALILGEAGRVEGKITADSVTIRGHVDGEIVGNLVRLEKTAQITGDISHQTISIEAGARISGQLIHVDDVQKPKASVNQTDSEASETVSA